MNESKIDLTHRLHREKRWEEASRFKDEEMSKLRAGGMKRSEAQEAAWAAMEENFPPITGTKTSGLTETDWSDLMDIPGSSLESFITDATWVYERLAVTGIKPSDAISPGAWSMLQWAKSNPDRFFEQMMPKLFGAKQKTQEVTRSESFDFCDDLSAVESLIRETRQRMDESAMMDVSKTVKVEVKNAMDDLTRRFSSDFPHDAVEQITTAMTLLADKLIKAAIERPGAYRGPTLIQ